MLKSFSLLFIGLHKKLPVSLREISLLLWYALATYATITCCGQYAQAYTVIQGPPALETAFIASTTNQYFSMLTINPFFPDTYQIQLIGPNPAYNPPLSNMDLLNALVTVDSYTYVYGFTDGQVYERQNDLKILGGFSVNCSSPTFFTLINSSIASWNQATCEDTLSNLQNSIYQQNFSSPTVITGF